MSPYIALAVIAILILAAWAIERRVNRNYRTWTVDRPKRAAKPQDLSQPIEWDDGLDVSKLEVRHEPAKKQSWI